MFWEYGSLYVFFLGGGTTLNIKHINNLMSSVRARSLVKNYQSIADSHNIFISRWTILLSRFFFLFQAARLFLRPSVLSRKGWQIRIELNTDIDFTQLPNLLWRLRAVLSKILSGKNMFWGISITPQKNIFYGNRETTKKSFHHFTKKYFFHIFLLCFSPYNKKYFHKEFLHKLL